MLQPKAEGAPIDDARFAKWADRYADYHKRPTRQRLRNWLEQFNQEDQDLAARVLDAVEYWPHEKVEDALVTQARAITGWSKDAKKRQGRWRIVAFARASGESGNAMLHKFRIAAGLNTPGYDSIFIEKRDLLQEDLTPDDTVIFIDDFAGTGTQICDCWNEVMAELLPGKPRMFLLLVAARIDAVRKIEAETPLRVMVGRKLRAGDDIFNAKCTHFKANDQQRLLEYCLKVDADSPRGFGSCGLAFVLAHNTPNNSIPILHKSRAHWTPIFPSR